MPAGMAFFIFFSVSRTAYDAYYSFGIVVFYLEIIRAGNVQDPVSHTVILAHAVGIGSVFKSFHLYEFAIIGLNKERYCFFQIKSFKMRSKSAVTVSCIFCFDINYCSAPRTVEQFKNFHTDKRNKKQQTVNGIFYRIPQAIEASVTKQDEQNTYEQGHRKPFRYFFLQFSLTRIL